MLEWIKRLMFSDDTNRQTVAPELPQMLRDSLQRCDSREQAVLLTNHAFHLVDKERIDDALTYLKTALAVDPQYAHAYNELAFVFGEKRKLLRLARAFARRAMECSPKEPKYHNSFFSTSLDAAEQESSRDRILWCANTVLNEIDLCLKRHFDYPPIYLVRARALALLGKSRNVWENEIRRAEASYFQRGTMGSGVDVEPEFVARAVARARRRCAAAVTCLSRASAAPVDSCGSESVSAPRVFVSYSAKSDTVREFVDSSLREKFISSQVSFFDYRMGESDAPRNEDAIFQLIDNELARATVFLHLLDFPSSPQATDIGLKMKNIESGIVDFLNDYEWDRSYDFPSTRNNRIQIVFADATARFTPLEDQIIRIYWKAEDRPSDMARRAVRKCVEVHNSS